MPDAVQQNAGTLEAGDVRPNRRSRRRVARPAEILFGLGIYLVLFYLVMFKSGFVRCVVRSFLASAARRHSNAWLPRAAFVRAGAISAMGVGCVLIVAHAFAQGATRAAPAKRATAVEVQGARLVAGIKVPSGGERP